MLNGILGLRASLGQERGDFKVKPRRRPADQLVRQIFASHIRKGLDDPAQAIFIPGDVGHCLSWSSRRLCNESTSNLSAGEWVRLAMGSQLREAETASGQQAGLVPS